MTFVLLLVILTMTDLCWCQCRTAAWWIASDPKAAWAECRYKTELLGGFYRNSNKGKEDVIGLLEAVKCCEASVSIQNKTSYCFNDDWSLQLDGNNVWGICSTGYFLQGLYRSDNAWLSNIESGRCCKFNALPKFYLHCYNMGVGKEFDSKGWITCAADYYITGFFKGGCNKLSCLEGVRCCSLYDGCQMARWKSKFDRPGWVHCDSSTHYITGLYRHDNRGSNDTITLLEAAKCCPAPAPDQKKASVCQNGDWSLTLDRENVWAECPAGYFIRGFRRSTGHWLHNIEEAQCCKPNGFPNRYETCYEESISFDKRGLSKCTKSDYYVTGIYKGNCRQLYCIKRLRCCKMNIDECRFSNPCNKGEVCSDTAGSYKCTCPSGYEGKYCDKDIDECAKGICKNGATCVNLQGSYRCKCNSGYNGTNCETEINECLSSPCKNGAKCVNVEGSYLCDCKSGYTGNNCEKDKDECAKGICKNGATCANLPGSYRCNCNSGYKGRNCETEINKCLSSPCKNGATCVNVGGSYRCDCKSGYTGNDCETGIKYCIPGPCQNGGTCIDLGGSYVCVCANGFFGANCEDSEDDSECIS